MNPKSISDLFKDYANGKLSPEENSKLESWYLAYASQSDVVMSDIEVKDSLNHLRKQLGIKSKIFVKLWPYIAIASCLLLTIGLYFYLNLGYKPDADLTQFADVEPGKNAATLTLDDGRKIFLTDSRNGELAQEGNIKISKKDGQLIYQIVSSGKQQNKFNTLSTVNGETYAVILPDKSKVWLNAASSLKYPASFATLKNRTVELTGEAYFEIAKDAQHPFVVKTQKQLVKVLGTHFNINSYTDEQSITTTLLEGSVQLNTGKTTRILKVGEQAVNENDQISISKANIDSITDWVNGDFYLDDMNFKVAMRKIARWYNLEVIYDQSISQDIETGGAISRKNKLSTVLHLIEKSGQVHFKLAGKKLYVTK
ncbi:FecR family protein [Pedobacter sp.]|uniref:FecR family protein n=1 Tax=Pedobacter sp. TaxID=1411316 RepID=UPI003BA9C259